MTRQMTAEFFAHSPVLLAPVVALFIFMAVFVVVSVRAFAKKKVDFDVVSRLPLDGEE